jgi:uncharacterized Zn finger protein
LSQVPPNKPSISSQPPKYQPPAPASAYRPLPQQRPLPIKPRKVRGGLKLPHGDIASESAWTAQRWLRLLEQAGDGKGLVEGLEYARGGQTKRMTIEIGRVEGQVQGRDFRPYSVTLTLDTIAVEQWEKVIAAMSDGAAYAAKLHSGELPQSIEDVFAPHGQRLFPAGPGEVRCTCTCGHAQTRTDEQGQVTFSWCKHVACVGYLLASRLAEEPFVLFRLRGIEGADVLDRLRARRAVVGAVSGSTAVYQQRPAAIAAIASEELATKVESFWTLGESAKNLDLTMDPPAVSHPLLRRLGQSPWTGQAKFPLVGLLASCYDVISEKVRNEVQAEVQETENEVSPGGT